VTALGASTARYPSPWGSEAIRARGPLIGGVGAPDPGLGRAGFWIVEDGVFRPCQGPAREFASIVCLHTHSCYSKENLAGLNWVVELGYMRPFRGLLQRSFGLAGIPDLDYRQLCYYPPFRPEDIWRMETENAARLGFDRLLLAITDHDEVTGSLELRQRRPDHAGCIGLGEELSIRYDGHVFHLGLSGLPEDRLHDVNASLQAAARAEQLDAVFEQLAALGCLVVLNHPLIAWSRAATEVPALGLLKRYGWAIAALELNGMRPSAENQHVVELARHVGKPLVGGGDSHLLMPSGALCASRATSYADFIAEVRSGWSRPLVTREYFSSLRWKLFLRVLSFIAQYREIAQFRGEPIHAMLDGRWVALDPVGTLANLVLRLSHRLRCSA
jgi:hypothetical protein